MKPFPKAGDIWRWQFSDTYYNRDYSHVLLLERKGPEVWVGLDLDDGETGEWYFLQQDMKHWKHIA